jgi:hypothetical protein
MASPMSDYSYSNESRDFLNDYTKKVKSDPRLEFHQDIIQDFGESYERAYQLWNTYYAEAYKDLSFYLGNQWSLEELSYLNNQRRSSFTYNKTFRLINLVLGRFSSTMRGYLSKAMTHLAAHPEVLIILELIERPLACCRRTKPKFL